jgi:hypothetical protein
MKKNVKTEAALLDSLGNVISAVYTNQVAGNVRYYYQVTIDGTPVNTRIGKISRSRKNLDKANRLTYCERYYYLCEGTTYTKER